MNSLKAYEVSLMLNRFRDLSLGLFALEVSRRIRTTRDTVSEVTPTGLYEVVAGIAAERARNECKRGTDAASRIEYLKSYFVEVLSNVGFPEDYISEYAQREEASREVAI